MSRDLTLLNDPIEPSQGFGRYVALGRIPANRCLIPVDEDPAQRSCKGVGKGTLTLRWWRRHPVRLE